MKANNLKKVIILAAALLPTSAWADELLSGPYYFDTSMAVHAKPAMLADGWGMTVGGAWETVINETVTAGVEVNADIPVVPFPNDQTTTVSMLTGGLRLGAMINSHETLHSLFNNTLGVGLLGQQAFLLNESVLSGELNVTKAIRIFAGAGYRFTYGINNDRGLSDANARGLFFDVGLRYGEIGR